MPNQQKDDVYTPPVKAWVPKPQPGPAYHGQGMGAKESVSAPPPAKDNWWDPKTWGYQTTGYHPGPSYGAYGQGMDQPPVPAYDPNRDRWYQDPQVVKPNGVTPANRDMWWGNGVARERPMDFQGGQQRPAEPGMSAPAWSGPSAGSGSGYDPGFPVWQGDGGGYDNGGGGGYGRSGYNPGYGYPSYEQPKPQPKRYDYGLTNWRF